MTHDPEIKPARRRAVFLDRDGVLNEAIVKNGVSQPPACARHMVLCAHAGPALDRLRRLGLLRICVTNQPDVARGSRTRANVDSMNRRIRVLLHLDDLYACLHDNRDNCQCRKPKPGMLLAAARKWNIDLAQSWMVGDRESDILAGRAAGCRTILLPAPQLAVPQTQADYICRDLEEVANLVESCISPAMSLRRGSI